MSLQLRISLEFLSWQPRRFVQLGGGCAMLTVDVGITHIVGNIMRGITTYVLFD